MMDPNLLDRLETRIEALLLELERLRADRQRMATEVKLHQEDRGELERLRAENLELQVRCGNLGEKLAAAPDPRLLAEIRSRVTALVGKLEAQAVSAPGISDSGDEPAPEGDQTA